MSVDTPSPARTTIGVFLVSLLAIPVCYGLSYYRQMSEDSLLVFGCGVVICFLMIPYIAYKGLLQALPEHRSWAFYLFTIFAFTALVDLLLAFTIDGYTMACYFYLMQGEPYLNTAHGALINYWDGIVHYGLYLIMIYYMLSDQGYRFIGLFWVGSIANSMISLLGGAAAGHFGLHIKPSYLLNVPYAVFPVVFGLSIIHSRSTYVRTQVIKHPSSVGTIGSILSRPYDFFFVFYFLAATAFAIFRVLVVLGSPISKIIPFAAQYETYLLDTSGFAQIQVLTYGFYFIPFYIQAIYALLTADGSGSASWLPDEAALHAGASAQAQFAYYFAQLRLVGYKPDPTMLLIHVLLFIIPQLFAIRCCSNDAPLSFFPASTTFLSPKKGIANGNGHANGNGYANGNGHYKEH